MSKVFFQNFFFAADGGGLGSALAPAGAVRGVQRGTAQAGEVKHPVVAQAEGLQYIIMHIMQYSTLHHINQTLPHLQELAVLLALQRVGDLPLGRAEAGVPAVVVAALRHEGVAAAGPRLPQHAVVHTLARGAAQEAAGGDQGRAAGSDQTTTDRQRLPVQSADTLVKLEELTVREGTADVLTQFGCLH